MKKMLFTQAADDALAYAMTNDPNIIVFGEDINLIRRNLLAQFGPERVRNTPISESAFLLDIFIFNPSSGFAGSKMY